MAITLRFLIISVIFCGANAQFQRASQFQRQTLAPTPSLPQNDVPMDFSNIDTLREVYLILEKALWRLIKADRAVLGQEQLLQRIHSVHLSFYAEKFNENGVYLFDPYQSDQSDQSTLRNEIEKVNLTLNSIRDVYLQTRINDAQRSQVLGFSRNIVNMTNTMDAIYNLTMNNDIFYYLKKQGEVQNCSSSNILTESTNQKLYEYYVDISAAQLKAYSLVQLAYMFLTVYNDNNYSAMLAENLRMRFHEQTIATQAHVRDLMEQSGRETWNCDQEANEYQLKGVSNQVTKLLQGYVDNEVNLNPTNTCKKTCPDYTLTKNHQCYEDTLCDPARGNRVIKKCSGNVVNCRESLGNMKICPSIGDRSRNYNYITLKSGTKLGQAGTCEAEEAEANSWIRGTVRCSVCFCYCDEESRDSHRYFSLQPVLSDTERNMVITGVSIIKDRQTFYWQITQRTLISKGQVENPPTNIQKPYKTIRTINVKDDPMLKEGIDYHTLSYENRSVNLDTLVAPAGSVITGIKFKAEKGHLSFEIRATKFDFNSGNLQELFDSEWISSTTRVRVPILLEYPDKSDRSQHKSVPNITPNRYIDFQPTDIVKDAAQTTVPFIDTELVEPTHPTILSGIGLYYKGQPGYGGFIAPKIIPYDFAPHIKVKMN